MRRAAHLLLIPVAACAGNQRSSPSLLPRAIETRGFAEPAPPAPVPVAPDASLDAEIAVGTASLSTSDAAFTKAATRAAALTARARGDKAGGERWIEAQSALAELDIQRATTSDLSSTLEQRAVDRAAALQPDYPALEAARAAARAQLNAETARVADLQAALSKA